jgi:predicted transcriptional regulator
MPNREKTISFRADAEKIEALDGIASAQHRSRSYLINEAIANYIELHAYQDALVEKGLEEMQLGKMASHADVAMRWTKSRRGSR